MGAEFAEQFPKIAARLALDGHRGGRSVRRAAAGGVQLSLRPRPAQARRRVPALRPAPARDGVPALPRAHARDGDRPVPAHDDRGRARQRASCCRAAPRCAARCRAASETACQFRTAHDVTLWPVELVDARYLTARARSPAQRAAARESRSGASCGSGCETIGALPFEQIALDRLTLFLSGSDEVALKLYELLLGQRPRRPGDAAAPGPVAVVRVAAAHGDPAGGLRRGAGAHPVHDPLVQRLPAAARVLRVPGALPLHRDDRAARAARACTAATRSSSRCPSARGDPGLSSLVDRGSFALNCTPAINLFPRRADRIHVTRPAVRAPHRGGSHAADGLRGLCRRPGRRLRRGRRRRAGVPPVLLSVDADARLGRRLLHRAARAARAVRGAAPRRGRGPATSAARCSSRWSTRARRRTPGGSASSRSRCSCTNRDLPLLMPVGGRRGLQPGRLRAGRGRALPARPDAAARPACPRARSRGG